MTLTFGSLFDGIYGFGLGFERAGMSCAWRSEIDKNCNALMEQRRPGMPNLGDVRHVGKRNAKAVDVICGGFPCQDLSVAGKRAGLAGERSGLWHQFHRIVKECKPRWVVVENVPGLLSASDGSDFLTVIRGLDQCGYGVAWRVLDAQYFGLAQRRRRVFVVASLGNASCAQVLFEPESLSGDFAPSREEGQRVARTIGRGTNSSGGIGYSNQEIFSQRGDSLIRPDDLLTFQNTGHGYWQQRDIGQTVRTPDGGGSMEANLVAFQQNTRDEVRYINGDGNIAGALSAEAGMHQQNYLACEMTHADEVFRPSGDKSPTLQSRMGTGGNQVPLVGVRRLTPTECERLQGFPDGWTGGFADSVRYKMLGNAVAVPCAEWIGRRIVEIESGKA